MKIERVREAPLSEILANTATNVIDTQTEIYNACIEVARKMKLNPSLPGKPSFYQLGETSIDLKLALLMARQSYDGSLIIEGIPTNADYCNEFQYDAEGASLISAKLVPMVLTDEMKTNLDKAIEDSYPTKCELIQEFLFNRDITDLTTRQLEAVGLQNVHDSALEDYQTAISEADNDVITTFTGLQALIDQVNAQRDIRCYHSIHNADDLTIEQLKIAGLENIATNNLVAYQEIVAGDDTSLEDSTERQEWIDQLQVLIDAKDFAIIQDKEEQYIGKDASTLTLEQLQVAGVDANTLAENNLNAYRSALALDDSITDLTDLQELIDAVNLGAIRETSLKGDASALSAEQIKATGIIHFVADYFPHYQDSIANAFTIDLYTVQSPAREAIADYRTAVTDGNMDELKTALQALIDAMNILVIQSYNSIDKAKALTIENLEAMGVATEDIVAANLDAYRQAVATDAALIGSLETLQAVIERENTLANLRNNRFLGDLTDLAELLQALEPSDQLVRRLALNYVINRKVLDYQSAIFKERAGFPSDLAALQGLINRVNAAGPLDKKVDLQILIDRENAIFEISDYTLGGNADALTFDQLQATGAIKCQESYLEQYQTAIASANAINDFAMLQALVIFVNGIQAGNPTIIEFKVVGIENSIKENKEGYQEAIANAGNPVDIPTVQTLIDQTNLAVVLTYLGKDENEFDDQETFIAQLTATGLNNVRDGNVDGYTQAFSSTESGSLTTVDQLQTLIDMVNSLEAIEQYRAYGDASRLTLLQLEATQAENIEANNLEAYRTAIAASAPLDDIIALQRLIDETNQQQ